MLLGLQPIIPVLCCVSCAVLPQATRAIINEACSPLRIKSQANNKDRVSLCLVVPVVASCGMRALPVGLRAPRVSTRRSRHSPACFLLSPSRCPNFFLPDAKSFLSCLPCAQITVTIRDPAGDPNQLVKRHYVSIQPLVRPCPSLPAR